MRKYYNERYLDVEFNKGDLIMLRYININIIRLCKKLNYKKLGPYAVQRKFGSIIYELNLPQDIEIKRTFHINKLKKWNPTIPG